MRAKLLLLLGPTGVGKTTLIRDLKELDSRFTYISPFTTRPLRLDERDKIFVPQSEWSKMKEGGAVIWVNSLYGYEYGTPKDALFLALNSSMFPVIDWPVTRVQLVRDYLGPDRVMTVYVEPPSLDELGERLAGRGEMDASRLEAAKRELVQYERGEFASLIDAHVTNEFSRSRSAADAIRRTFLRSFSPANEPEESS